MKIVANSSLAMEDRNKLFKKAHGLLVKEGASHEEARKLVKEKLIDSINFTIFDQSFQKM